MSIEKAYNKITIALAAALLIFIALRFGWLAVFLSASVWYLGGTQGFLVTCDVIRNEKIQRNKCIHN